jgi:hypothetical protein
MSEQIIGSKAQVWHETAKKTSGGLIKKDLMKNKHGRIVSKKKYFLGKKSLKYLKKMGYVTKKGHFKLFHKKNKSHKMRGGYHNKMRGGCHVNHPLSPANYDGEGVGTSGVDLQFVAGNAG